MRTAVIGAGAIGCLTAGYLKLKGKDVSLVGRSEAVKAIRDKGLEISGVRGSSKLEIPAAEYLNYKPQLVILATKTQDIKPALEANISLIRDALLVTTQNGVQAENICAGYIPAENIVASIIMFGATNLKPGKVVHNFEGSWILGLPFSDKDADKMLQLSAFLESAFSCVIADDIKGMKFLKIFVNANNCIPAILGKSMQEVFSDPQISRISIAIWKEGLQIVSQAGIKLVSLPGFAVENVTRLVSMPGGEAAKVFSGIMRSLSDEPLYGSILQSIMRGRPSEVDYINGEFLKLAETYRSSADLNKLLVDMVHEVEQSNRFFSKEELLKATRCFVN